MCVPHLTLTHEIWLYPDPGVPHRRDPEEMLVNVRMINLYGRKLREWTHVPVPTNNAFSEELLQKLVKRGGEGEEREPF